MITQEQKDKWLSRLRDPNSQQYIGGGIEWTIQNNGSAITLAEPMCCLMHGEVALKNSGSVHTYWNYMIGRIGIDHLASLVMLNDEKKIPLPEIADWIEANIPAGIYLND